jgi:energy-coupling factor transporter transmembrane protein EcfT
MDDQPSSDQPTTSATIMLIWMLTGIVLVSAAFFLSPYSRPWISLNVAGAVAGLYLIALLFYVARKPLRFLFRVTLICLGLLVVGVTTYSWVRSQSYVKEQRESQILLQKTGARSILFSGMSAQLLRTLQEFHGPAKSKNHTLREVFLNRFGPVAVGQIVPPPLKSAYYDYESYIFMTRRVYLRSLEADKIVLVGVDGYNKGREQSFGNINGKSGLIQEKLTLTPKGIVHESEN